MTIITGLYVAIPAYSGVQTPTMLSIVKLRDALQKRKIPFYLFVVPGCSVIAWARDLAAHEFLKLDGEAGRPNASHLLFVDSDISFEPDTILRMIESDEPLVAVACPKKVMHWKNLRAGSLGNLNVSPEHLAADFVFAPDKRKEDPLALDERGLIVVKNAGTGLMMIQRHVLASIEAAGTDKFSPDGYYYKNGVAQGPNGPISGEKIFAFFHFRIRWDEHDKCHHYDSEDYSFCLRWKELDGRVAILADATVGHTGPHTFTGNLHTTLAIEGHWLLKKEGGVVAESRTRGVQPTPERPKKVEVAPAVKLLASGRPSTYAGHTAPGFTLDEGRTLREMRTIATAGYQGHMPSLEPWFCVVLPTFNRANTLPACFHSLFAQTHPYWVCVVLDDGSTDDTKLVVKSYEDKDPRILYVRHDPNRGGVAMNEIGMSMACAIAPYWTRLGSDDWFGPEKLARDHSALSMFRRGPQRPSCPSDDIEACYGSFHVEYDGALHEHWNPSYPSALLREKLRSGHFEASWANIAVRTSALKKVKDRYGSFCDPRLRNMEDFVFNARLVSVAKLVWRGLVNGKLVVDPDEQDLHSDDVEAVWRKDEGGASGDRAQSKRDDELSRRIIADETARFP